MTRHTTPNLTLETTTETAPAPPGLGRKAPPQAVPPAARSSRAGPERRARRPSGLPLSVLIAEFLDEVDQTLAPASLRAYQVPLDLYLRHLRTALDHEPTLDDLTVETARAWIAQLRATPKRQNQGRAAGEHPITLASLHNYVRHLRAFASWLAKPPRKYCTVSPLKYLKLPRAEETPKVPV